MENKYEHALANCDISFAHPGGERATRLILEDIGHANAKRILEVGCGLGSTCLGIANHYSDAEVYGIDHHPLMVRKAQERVNGTGVTIEIGNIESLQFDQDFFDIVIAESVLTFTDVEKSIKEIQRVLKRGGSFYLNEMVKEDDLFHEEEVEIKDFYKISRILSEQEWCDSLKGLFTSVEVLSGHSIYEEWEKMNRSEIKGHSNPQAYTNEILATHQRLNGKYGDVLGYRLIKAISS